VLGQLRRGTLGTGVPTVHSAGSKVQDIGPSETIPYSDTTKSEQVTINGSTTDLIIPLSFVPSKSDNWSKDPNKFNLFDSAEINKFISKTGTGPYLVKVAIPQQDYAPAVGKQLIIEGNSNTLYNGTYSVSDTDVSNQSRYVPTAIANTTLNGTAINIQFTIPVQSVAPETGVYYTLSGTVPLEYNSTWLCTASSLTSITLTITTNYGAITKLPTTIEGTNTITLSYPNDPGTFGSSVTTISAPRYGQSDNIDVFVGGYDESTVWTPNTIFEAEQIVTINSYTYRMTTKHKSGATFNSAVTTLDEDNNVINTNVPATTVRTFFIGNIRLKKHPYSIYNVENAPTSPEGDVSFDADFAVDGVNAELVLLNKLTPGTVVTIIRKTGKTWTENNEDLQVSQTKIAKFITAVPGVWVTNNQTTSTASTTPSTTTTFDAVNKTFDNDDTTFDQGT